MNKKIISIPPNYFYACLLFNIVTIFIPYFKKVISFPFDLLGIPTIIFGFYLIMTSYNLFKKHNTPEKFEKPTCIVKKGLYKYSRNPMYLGAIIFLIGLSILIGNIISFISPMILFVVLNFMFIPYEEEKMEKEFGKEYLKYRKEVRRWI